MSDIKDEVELPQTCHDSDHSDFQAGRNSRIKSEKMNSGLKKAVCPKTAPLSPS